MTVLRDPDAILAAWLEEGPDRLPEATARAIAVTTRTTHQTRRPMWVPWRFPTMNGTSRLVLAAAAVVAVALGGLYLFNRPPDAGVGGPAASPASPAPSPTATPMPFPTDTSGGVPVAPGTYALDLPTRNSTTGAAAPLRITFTVPAGWQKNLTPTTLWHSTEPGLRFSFHTVDNLYVDPCGSASGLLDPPLGPTIGDLATGLLGLTDLAPTAPSDVTFGGFNGTQLGLAAPVELPSCNDGYRALWTGPQGAVTDVGGAAIAASEKARWFLLDVDGVRLVVGQTYHRDAPAARLAEIQAIVDSVRIERLPVVPSDAPSPNP